MNPARGDPPLPGCAAPFNVCRFSLIFFSQQQRLKYSDRPRLIVLNLYSVPEGRVWFESHRFNENGNEACNTAKHGLWNQNGVRAFAACVELCHDGIDFRKQFI